MSEVPRAGISEQEFRIRDILAKMHLYFGTNQVYCFVCMEFFANPNGMHFPSMCSHCLKAYADKEKGLYALPDFVINNDGKKGVLYINGHGDDSEKMRKKVRNQVRALRTNNIKVFVLDNSEIDNCTNATLIAYLKSVWRAVDDDALYDQMYRNEREYYCLRN